MTTDTGFAKVSAGTHRLGIGESHQILLHRAGVIGAIDGTIVWVHSHLIHPITCHGSELLDFPRMAWGEAAAVGGGLAAEVLLFT